MGGNPYWYYAKYQTDIETTQRLKRCLEFKAGRYNPIIASISFPIADDTPAPGSQPL